MIPVPYPAPYPIYMDEGEADGLPGPQPRRRAPARLAPEKAGPRLKSPQRRPPPAAPPTAPARANSGVPPAGESRFVAREVLVTLAADAEPLARDLARTQRLRLLATRPLALTGALLVRYRIPDGRTVAAVITALEGDSRVRAAQPNYLYTLMQASPPPQGGLAAAQYGLARLRAGVAQLNAKGVGVLAAVIDSGVDGQHRELAGTVTQSVDVTGASAAKPPADVHGTAIAGIIAAHDQMSGVAPGARIMAIRAFAPPSGKGGANRSGSHGSSQAVILGLEAAVQAKARVVNMSFAGPRDPLLSETLAAAAAKGVVLVAAAGNDGPDAAPAWPAADPHVIAVTATDANDQRIAAAGRGDHIAIAAPGADIIAPAPGDAYQFSTGSSMAAAHVTGAVALLLEADPALTPAGARQILTETAKDLGPAGRDADTGAGLVDAAAAVAAAKKITATGQAPPAP